MTRVRRFFRMYRPFTRAGFQEAVAYRANFICFLIGEIMSAFIMYFVWKAVFTNSDTPMINGFTMGDMVVYLFISFLTGYLSYSDGAFAVGEEIRDGAIAMRMLKPCSFDMCFLFQELGIRLINIVMIFLPITAGVEIYRYILTGAVCFDIRYFLIYLVSLLLAYMISFYFNVCYGFMAFLPASVAMVLDILPFASLSYTPVMIYMGMYSAGEIALHMGLQVFWLLFMFGLSKLIWHSAVRRLAVQGG